MVVLEDDWGADDPGSVTGAVAKTVEMAVVIGEGRDQGGVRATRTAILLLRE